MGVGLSDEGPMAGVVSWRVSVELSGGLEWEMLSPGDTVEGSGGGGGGIADWLRVDVASAGFRFSVKVTSWLRFEVTIAEPSLLDDLGRGSSLLNSTGVDEIGAACVD